MHKGYELYNATSYDVECTYIAKRARDASKCDRFFLSFLAESFGGWRAPVGRGNFASDTMIDITSLKGLEVPQVLPEVRWRSR